jgi:hypothetical protein
MVKGYRQVCVDVPVSEQAPLGKLCTNEEYEYSNIAGVENTLNLDLEEEAPSTEYDVYGNRISSVSGASSEQLSITQAVIPAPTISYVSPTVTKVKVQPSLDTKIICYDTETSGTDPWDYQLYVCSFWDLSKPISEIVTFSGWDEEKLINEIAAYLNEEKPDALVQYNNGFDERALLTRFMLYQVSVPGWNGIDQIDVMDILKKGTTKSIASSQATGTEEQWLTYFFNETKPFTIEECFEGVRNKDLTRLIIRNRTCVESEGSIYLLFRFVTDAEPLVSVETKPTAVHITKEAEAGICLVKCPTCEAVNDVPCTSHNNTCWRCLGNLPDPTEANRVKEVLREVDYSQVGIKKTTAK